MILLYLGVTVIYIFLMWRLIKKALLVKVDNESYFFANRSLNQITLGLTLMATQVGGGIMVGVCDAAYKSGLMGYSYALGQMLGLLMVYVFFSRAFQKLQLQTISEIFTKVYQSGKLRKIASLLSVLSLGLVLVAQAVAVKKLFFAMGFTSFIPLYIIWGGVVAYTAIGGFSAVVKTDVVQILLILVGLFVIGLNIPAQDYIQVASTLNLDNVLDFNQFANYIIWPCCYIVIEQDMVQRFGASPTLSKMRKALLISMVGVGACALLPLIMGMLANMKNIPISAQSSVLIEFSKAYLPAGFVNVTIFILLMAIISTVDSLLCAISNLISCDALISVGKDNSYLKNSVITFIVGFMALAGGIYFESVLKMLVFAYGLTASALFVPGVVGILGWSKNTKAAMFSVSFGVVSYCVFSLWNETVTVFALVVSAIGFIAGIAFERSFQSAKSELVRD